MLRLVPDGAQLARAVKAAGYQVVEAARMSAKDSHGIGTSDPQDARRIAASVLPLRADQQRYLRIDNGVRAGLRVLLAARDHMTSERTATVNALIALLRVLDLGIDARKPLTGRHIVEVSKWRSRTEAVGRSSHAPKRWDWPSVSSTSMNNFARTPPRPRH